MNLRSMFDLARPSLDQPAPHVYLPHTSSALCPPACSLGSIAGTAHLPASPFADFSSFPPSSLATWSAYLSVWRRSRPHRGLPLKMPLCDHHPMLHLEPALAAFRRSLMESSQMRERELQFPKISQFVMSGRPTDDRCCHIAASYASNRSGRYPNHDADLALHFEGSPTPAAGLRMLCNPEQV